MVLEVSDPVSYAIMGCIFVIAYFLALAAGILVFMPIQVVLTASRANYTPKAVNLNQQSIESSPSTSALGFLYGFYFYKDAISTTGTSEKTTLSFFGRIKRLEGSKGLYRGTVWFILSMHVLMLIALSIGLSIYFLSRKLSIDAEHVYVGWEGELLTMFITFPLSVIQARAIVHPVRLNWFNLRDSLKNVTNESEYSQPWRLYKIPGAFLAYFSRWFLIGPCTRLLKWNFIGGGVSMSNENSPITFSTRLLGIVPLFVWLVVLVSIVTMLDCIFVRLAIQRSKKSYRETIDTTGSQAGDIEAMRSSEPIVSLRPCFGEQHPGWNYFNFPYLEPYKGILDCARKMRDEEGWGSLRRAALVSMVSCLVALLS